MKFIEGKYLMENYNIRVEKLKKLIDNANYILIGAGAGLSTAAGIEYSGKRFRDNFPEFIKKYGFQDMYSSMFYPFKSSEEKWAYFAKHAYVNNIGMEGTYLYKKLLNLVKNKDYFVITTNTDDQFLKSGFDENRFFRVQGSYAKMQCSKACHEKLYDDEELILEMIEKTDENLKIPTELLPKCPVCSEEMDLNLRKDSFFVEDDSWHKQKQNYINFRKKALGGKLVLLEFGIGFNTPIIIRFPFDDLMKSHENVSLVRFNRSHLELTVQDNGNYYLIGEDELENYLNPNIKERYLPFNEDITKTLNKLI
ncbi:SIR2 family NAD-dependent protein deacylase [Methanobrevibacter olleyae]|nr:Sir2 family NAD-dependent protein deacetylase [Methanobrevibacter olleyae]